MVSQRYIDPVQTFEEISDEIVVDMIAKEPSATIDKTDPRRYWADITGNRENAQAVKFNKAADENYLLRASGDALTELAKSWGVASRNTGETDDDLRQRIYRLWDSITIGTHSSIIRRVKDISSLVKDASVAEKDWANNTQNVYVLDENGDNLTPEQRAEIQALMNAPDKPEDYIDYVIPEANVIYYLVSGSIVYNAKYANPLAQVETALQDALQDLKKLDTGIDDSTIIAYLPGRPVVNRVELSIVQATKTGDICTPGASALMPELVNTVYVGVYKAKTGTDTFHAGLTARTTWS